MVDPLDDFNEAVDQLEADLEVAVGRAVAVTNPLTSIELEERRRILGELKAWVDNFWVRHRALLAGLEGVDDQRDAVELRDRLGMIAWHANDQLTWRVEQGLARFGIARAIIDPRLARPRLIDRGIAGHPRVVDRGVIARPVVD